MVVTQSGDLNHTNVTAYQLTQQMIDDCDVVDWDGNMTVNETMSLYRHSTTIIVVYCFAYSVIFLLGLVGNCLVVAVMIRCPQMRTVTNLFIVNLAVADILVVLFCLPANLLSTIYVPWIMGEVMCKVVSYVQGVSVVASIDSLVAVSLDRVLAICYPMKFQITKKRARAILLVIWIVALTTALPWPMYFRLSEALPSNPEMLFCMEHWPSPYEERVYFFVANILFCYLLPLHIILACYVMIWLQVWRRNIPTECKDAHTEQLHRRSKAKVIKMLVAVVVVFALSWLPLYIIFTRVKLSGKEQNFEEWEEDLQSIVMPIAQWLGLSNSCINPLLYAFLNKKYRSGFIAILKTRSCCAPIRLDHEGRSVASTVMRLSQRVSTRRFNAPRSDSVVGDSIRIPSVAIMSLTNV